MKTGRNDPCWCGSGKKYKKCCIGRDPLVLNEHERDAMRKACQFNSELMAFLRPSVVEGVTTLTLDRYAREYTLDHGHTPACLGYKGYEHTICTSVNDVVCHGVPNDIPLASGDIMNLDLTTIVDGWHGDQSEMFLIGEVSDEAAKLVRVTRECLELGIKALRPDCMINDLAAAIQRHAETNGYSVVREYQGHGVGRAFHQFPDILHFKHPAAGLTRLPAGYCFTVEPMINQGEWETRKDDDGWTVRTVDGKLSAQWEHTILMTEDGPEVLTR